MGQGARLNATFWTFFHLRSEVFQGNKNFFKNKGRKMGKFEIKQRKSLTCDASEPTPMIDRCCCLLT